MASTMSFIVAATLMAMAGVLVSGQQPPPLPACIQNLYPCEQYVMMGSNKPEPSLECCDAFYTVTQNDLPCLCSHLGDEPLLSPYGIDVAKTKSLPHMCNYNYDCALPAGESDPSSSLPSLPSEGVTPPSQSAQPSLPANNTSEPSDAPPSEPPTVETPPPSASQPSVPAQTPAPGSEAPGSEVPGSEAPGSEAPGVEAPGSEADGSEAPSSTSPGSLPTEEEMPEAEASLAQGSQALAASHGISKKGATAMHGLVIGGILAGLFIAA